MAEHPENAGGRMNPQVHDASPTVNAGADRDRSGAVVYDSCAAMMTLLVLLAPAKDATRRQKRTGVVAVRDDPDHLRQSPYRLGIQGRGSLALLSVAELATVVLAPAEDPSGTQEHAAVSFPCGDGGGIRYPWDLSKTTPATEVRYVAAHCIA